MHSGINGTGPTRCRFFVRGSDPDFDFDFPPLTHFDLKDKPILLDMDRFPHGRDTMSHRRRVMYFTMSTFSESIHTLGGNIYSRNNIQRLMEDDAIDLHVVDVNVESNREPTAKYFDSLGIKHHYIPVDYAAPRRADLGFWSRLRHSLATKYRIPVQVEALNQPHVAKEAEEAVRRWGIDYIVLDYVPAVHFWPTIFKSPIEKAIVTVNREADLFREALAIGIFKQSRLTGWISTQRLAAFERRVHRKFTKTIAIGEPDIPTYIHPSRTACITPCLDPRPDRWDNQGSKDVFFVGGMAHYPNKLAIEYIATRVAPLVSRAAPEIEFKIIGASEEQVPEGWRHPAVKYLGRSNFEEVERLFKSCRLFVCPVRNTFGMKYKVAEAISFGTPFLASPETMLCVPYLAGQPTISLDDPNQAAAEIVRFVRSDADLKALSRSITSKHDQFLASQQNIWSRKLFGEEKKAKTGQSWFPIRGAVRR